MNQDKYIEELIEPEDISKPEVKRDKNKKTISVSWTFDRGHIPIKLRLDYDGWLRLEELCTTKIPVQFEEIRPFISRPGSKNLADLEKYATEAKYDFSWDVYEYTCHASQGNPKSYIYRKPRGGSPYPSSRSEMEYIKQAARILYVFLYHWAKQPPDLYPKELNVFLAGRSLPKSGDEIVNIIQKNLSEKFSIDLTAIDPIDFSKNYIHRKSLKPIKEYFAQTHYKPTMDQSTKKYLPAYSILMPYLSLKVEF